MSRCTGREDSGNDVSACDDWGRDKFCEVAAIDGRSIARSKGCGVVNTERATMTDSNFCGREIWSGVSSFRAIVVETDSLSRPTLMNGPSSLLLLICLLAVAAFGDGQSRSVRLPFLAAVLDERVRGGRAVGRGG